jgi:hypothetical protein
MTTVFQERLPSKAPSTAPQQAGPHRRGVAASRGADDAEERGLSQPGDQNGDQPLPAEEEFGVLGLEGGQALEQAGDVGRRQALARSGRGLVVDHRRRAGAPLLHRDQEVQLGQLLAQ